MNESLIPARILLLLKEDTAFLKALARQDAERRRKRTQRNVDAMSTPESRGLAAKARASVFHAMVDEICAQGELAAIQGPFASEAKTLADIPIDDLPSLHAILDDLPDWLRERIKKVYAKLNWTRRDGKPNFFNKAFHKNGILVDKLLTIFAHLFELNDSMDLHLDAWVESVIECGLYPRIKQGKFEYGRRCHDLEHCELCNYIDITAGLKTLYTAYGPSTFRRRRGTVWYAITVAPRMDAASARAVGRVLRADDWDYANPDSVVAREARHGRVFVYPQQLDDFSDWSTNSAIRRFLGAVQWAFGKAVKNCWLDGIRARIENSFQFLPFASHYHWHAVGSSEVEHDPQKLAEFIKAEADAILAKTRPGVFADVQVVVISTAEDLRRWIKYMNKPVALARAVASVYNRYPGLRRTDPVFKEFYEELRLYPDRHRAVFKGARLRFDDERGAHTYSLRKLFVRGNHKFGKGSILTESDRHRFWRKKHQEQTAKRRAQQR